MSASFLERRTSSDLSTNVAYQLIEFARLVSGIYDIGHFHDLDEVALLFHVVKFELWIDA